MNQPPMSPDELRRLLIPKLSRRTGPRLPVTIQGLLRMNATEETTAPNAIDRLRAEKAAVVAKIERVESRAKRLQTVSDNLLEKSRQIDARIELEEWRPLLNVDGAIKCKFPDGDARFEGPGTLVTIGRKYLKVRFGSEWTLSDLPKHFARAIEV